MKITKRSDGRYCAKVTKDGLSKYIYGKTQKEVEAKLIDFKYMANKGVIIDDNRLTLEKLSEVWFNNSQKGNSPATQKRNQGIIDKYISQLGNYQITKIKPYQIQELLNNMMQDGKTDTVRKTYQVFHSMFELALNNDWIMKNPVNAVTIPTFKSKEKRPLTLEERQIIENSKNKYRDFFTFLLYTGLRRGEICALKWSDVTDNSININSSIDFSNANKGVKKSTKNGKSRNVPLLDKTREILSRVENTSQYVFTNQHGERLTETSLKRMLENFKKDTGLDFTLHQLRHTFCTMLYYSGISSKKAQQIMGHSSLDVTLKIYTHLDEEQEDNTLDKLNSYVKKLTTF